MANERPVEMPRDPHPTPLPRGEDVLYRRLEKHREALRAVVREMEQASPAGKRGASGRGRA